MLNNKIKKITVMNITLDDKRIKKIVYELEDGNLVTYNLKNGELYGMYISSNNSEGDEKPEKPGLTDSEMIEKIKNSEFMDELEDARKRFKIDKAIADTFPDKDEQDNKKRPENKYSDESLEVAKQIIKMDKDGKLDEILKRYKNESILDKYVREDIDSPLSDSDLSYDLSACQKNMNTIESKIVSRLRREDFDATKDDEFQKLLENYNFYKTKKKEIDDKIWAQVPKAQ
jgi:hypothetical protein